MVEGDSYRDPASDRESSQRQGDGDPVAAESGGFGATAERTAHRCDTENDQYPEANPPRDDEPARQRVEQARASQQERCQYQICDDDSGDGDDADHGHAAAHSDADRMAAPGAEGEHGQHAEQGVRREHLDDRGVTAEVMIRSDEYVSHHQRCQYRPCGNQ